MQYIVTAMMAMFINAVDAGRTQELIRQLDDPRFEVRQDADDALRQAGLQVVETLRQELKQGPPLEVARRLQGIIDHYVRPAWHQRLEEAVAEAKRTGKPILVMSMPPQSDDPDQWKEPEVADARLAHFLKQHYVVVWHISQADLRFLINNNNNDRAVNNWSGGVLAYLCDAEGKVLQQQSALPDLSYLAQANGTPRKLEPAENQVNEEDFAEVTPNGGVMIRQIKVQGQLQQLQVKQVQELQVQRVYWGRYRGRINPIGMAIQDVLGGGDLILRR